MDRILPFFFLLLVGQGCRHLKVFPGQTDRSLNLYVIYIALPALILKRVPGLHVSAEVLPPLLLPWLTIVCGGLLVILLANLLRWDRETTGALLLMVPLGNTSFFGIPMVELYFGAEAVRYAVLYDQFGSFLALSTYGAVILAIYGRNGGRSPKEIIRSILLFPPFLALATALALQPGFYPSWLDHLLTMAAGSLVPVVFVAIGFQMEVLLPGYELVPLVTGLFLRLLGVPLIMLLAMQALSIHSIAARVALFETAMPPMVAASALASIAGLKPRLCSGLVGFGIVAAFCTLPLIFRLSG